MVLLAFLFLSCGRNVKNEGENNTIYTNENMTIKGGKAGLSEHYKQVYLSAFADFVGDFDLERKIEKSIQVNLEGYGLVITKKIPDAQAVITGSIDSLIISPAGRITNLPGLLYSIQLTYSVNDIEKNYLQKDRSIDEHLLVLDTNSYSSNQAVEILSQNLSRHTAESIFYGWQLGYSKTTNQISTLGGSIETNSGTNRTEPNQQKRIH
jgi:hypothetical protein